MPGSLGAFVYITRESMNLMRVGYMMIFLQMHYKNGELFKPENQLHLNLYIYVLLHCFVHIFHFGIN